MDLFADKEFLADADKSRIDISPTSDKDVQKSIAHVFAAKADVEERAKKNHVRLTKTIHGRRA